MTRFRRPVLPAILLSALLALTSVALGMARGTVMSGESVILCSGAGAVVVTISPDGRPVGAPHVCPDMALSLLAAAEATPPGPPAARQASTAVFWSDIAAAAGRPAPDPIARGPPLRL